MAVRIDDDSEMIKNGQCQMCGHSVTEGHNCWDGRYASDMIYLKPSQMMKKRAGRKCSNCGCIFYGKGHNGAPLVEGVVCDTCQIKVLERRSDDVRKTKEELTTLNEEELLDMLDDKEGYLADTKAEFTTLFNKFEEKFGDTFENVSFTTECVACGLREPYETLPSKCPSCDGDLVVNEKQKRS